MSWPAVMAERPENARHRIGDGVVELVDPEALGPRVADLVAAGGRHVMLLGLDERSVGGNGLAVEAVMLTTDGSLNRVRAALAPDEPAYPSISSIMPAASWDERELKDLFGILPHGHPDPRRLVLHERWPRGHHPLRKDVAAGDRPPEADRHFVPFEVHGEGVYQLPVGPIHAGVIEPGHFRFSAVGERILHLDARLGFVHRGLEKIVEGRSFAAAAPVVERACGVCTVTHGLAYAEAVEQLTATGIPERARRLRVLLAELERLYNHVGDLGNVCAGIGFQPAVARLGWLKEQLFQLNDGLTGHRYLTGIVAPGGLWADVDAAALAGLPARLAAIGTELAAAIRAILRSEGVMARFHGTGIVPQQTALALGALGVAARASGVGLDLRRDRPSGGYRDLEVRPVTASGGDVAARFHVRAQEAHESLRIMREVLDRLPPGDISVPLAATPAVGETALGAAEGPRGASWIWLRAGNDGTIDRLHLRSASFANWPVVAAAVPGNLVPDFPLINKSFELCYACTDR
ncbi:MAG TPA: NADH-quinone oxidoreductase subunit C [Candidatus Limnocylindrales bacterium]|nr:NADH-quinone oxidoreductase subunit C [Candidatus Limnocylindrales bacterium]